MSSRIPGPGRWTTLHRLLPVPFRRFPDFLADMTHRYGNVLAFSLPWRSYVFVNEPALIKDILVTQQHAFSKSLGTRVLRLLLGGYGSAGVETTTVQAYSTELSTW